MIILAKRLMSTVHYMIQLCSMKVHNIISIKPGCEQLIQSRYILKHADTKFTFNNEWNVVESTN